MHVLPAKAAYKVLRCACTRAATYWQGEFGGTSSDIVSLLPTHVSKRTPSPRCHCPFSADLYCCCCDCCSGSSNLCSCADLVLAKLADGAVCALEGRLGCRGLGGSGGWARVVLAIGPCSCTADYSISAYPVQYAVIACAVPHPTKAQGLQGFLAAAWVPANCRRMRFSSTACAQLLAARVLSILQ